MALICVMLVACGGDEGLSPEERNTLCQTYDQRCRSLCDSNSYTPVCQDESYGCLADCLGRLGLTDGACIDPDPIPRECGTCVLDNSTGAQFDVEPCVEAMVAPISSSACTGFCQGI